MSERTPLPEIVTAPERGPVLIFAPHADDDVIGCGGTACLHARQGDTVHVVVVFDGALGVLDGSPREERSALRRAEALTAGAELGLHDYEFWDYPEGHEPGRELFLEAVRRAVDCIGEIEPRTVYAPWFGECSLDHHVTARAVALACELGGVSSRALGYEVWTPLVPTRVVDVTDVIAMKRRALAAHASQLAHTDLWHMSAGLSAHRSVYLPGGALYGEAFATLRAALPSDREWLTGSQEPA